MKRQQHLHAEFESFLVFSQMESQHESLKVASLATRMIVVRKCCTLLRINRRVALFPETKPAPRDLLAPVPSNI